MRVTHEGGIQDQWLDRLQPAGAYNRWIFSQIEAHLGRQVLEVGCGTGAFTTMLAAPGRVVHAIDIDADRVAAAREATSKLDEVHVEESDIAAAEWRERFDTVVMLDVLEHIEDDLTILGRLHDALVSGGKLVVKVPAMPALYGAADRAVGHHRRYTRRGLDRAVREAGFSDIEVWHFNAVGTVGWWINGRLLGRAGPPAEQIRAFDAMVPLLRRIDLLARAGIGLSLFAVAKRLSPA